MAALAAIGSVVSVSQRAADRADELESRLGSSVERLSEVEEQLSRQSIDLAAAQTSMRLLERDVGALGEEISVEEVDVAAVTRAVLASVFTVNTADGSGSSFVFSSEGGSSRLLTNAHVVSEVWNNGGRGVELVQGEQRLSASITDISFSKDLAILTVSADLPVLDFTKERADVGTPVLLAGSPLGLEGSVVSGVVSSYRVEEGAEQLQVSAPVNPGNSGGPVTDSTGTVLGVVVAKYVGFEVEGVGFAVPTDVVCSTFDIC